MQDFSIYILILTNSTKPVFVDKQDYEWASGVSWYAKKCRNMVYIAHSQRNGDKVRTVYLHREILGLSDSRTEGHHINGNTYDNRRLNLESRPNRPHLAWT